MHDLDADLISASKSCINRPREVHSEAVSDHFPICLGLSAYGHGNYVSALSSPPPKSYFATAI